MAQSGQSSTDEEQGLLTATHTATQVAQAQPNSIPLDSFWANHRRKFLIISTVLAAAVIALSTYAIIIAAHDHKKPFPNSSH